MTLTPRVYSATDQQTWRVILHEHAKKRDQQICDTFLRGVELLGINEEKIPNLEEINNVLLKKTGFIGRLVEGLEDGASFFRMLSQREFPVGNFIRSHLDLSYTPAPDIVHDLYGHLPFHTDMAYADYSQSFAQKALNFANRPELLRQFERFYWFTIEFGLVKTANGNRIFGAGISSSTAECDYALSGVPKVLPFDVDIIRKQEFKIDRMQTILFCLESPEQLYQSLDELVFLVENES